MKLCNWLIHLNVRFQYKADTRVEHSECLLSSVSGHSAFIIRNSFVFGYMKEIYS